MADRLVQENSRPARAEYDFHRAGRCVDRAKLENRLARAFAGKFTWIEIGGKDIQCATATTARLVIAWTYTAVD